MIKPFLYMLCFLMIGSVSLIGEEAPAPSSDEAKEPTPEHPPEIDEKRQAAARELAEEMKLREMLQAGFEANIVPMVDQQAKAFGLSSAEKWTLLGIYNAWFQDDLDQEGMFEAIVQLYAEAFTEEELRETLEFYRTDVGRKVLKTLPQLTEQGVQIGMQEAAAKQELLQKRLKPFLEEVKARKTEQKEAESE